MPKFSQIFVNNGNPAFEANIKDNFPKWDKATPINKKGEIFMHGIA